VKSDHQLNFFQHSVHFRASIPYVGPGAAYVYETFFVPCQDLPFKRSEWDVYLGDILLEAECIQENYIHVKLPRNAQDDMFRIRVFDSLRDAGPFKVLHHTEPFLTKHDVGEIFMQIYEADGDVQFTHGTDTLHESRFGKAIRVEPTSPVNIYTEGDTIRLKSTLSGADGYDVDLAVVEDEFGGLSGRLHIITNQVENNNRQDLEVWFKDMPWSEKNGEYKVMIFGPFVASHIVNAKLEDHYDDMTSKLLKFTGVTSASNFYIMIKP
jgi:hypothetical protein